MEINKKILVIGIVILIGIFSLFTFNNFQKKISGSVITGGVVNIDNLNPTMNQAIVYKSQSCGCCSGYISELEKNGFNVEIEAVSSDKLNSIKESHNIPKDMQSCHTVIIGNYFIEGHVPLEAVNKLLTEKPDVDGITLPGMDSGTPGMPGQKTGEWIIYSLKDGKSTEFMRI